MSLPADPGLSCFGPGADPPFGSCSPWWSGALSALAPVQPVQPLPDPAAPASAGSTAVWFLAAHPAPEGKIRFEIIFKSKINLKPLIPGKGILKSSTLNNNPEECDSYDLNYI